MIKKIVLIAGMGAMGLLWGSGDVTIQVINAVKERSITQEFDKKLVKSGLAVHKVVEGGRYIVTLGTYKNEKAAQAALKKARMVVCKEAFVRPVKRDQVTAVSPKCDKPVEAKKATPAASQEVTVATVPKNDHIVVIEVKNTPSPTVVASSSSEKKEAYRNEIAEAINYYKNSPYHRFEPVMLQP
ncbi:MAG: SPOR domain-containing protein [Sulfuricurvum sp.]|jgi:hypothetical protein